LQGSYRPEHPSLPNESRRDAPLTLRADAFSSGFDDRVVRRPLTRPSAKSLKSSELVARTAANADWYCACF